MSSDPVVPLVPSVARTSFAEDPHPGMLSPDVCVHRSMLLQQLARVERGACMDGWVGEEVRRLTDKQGHEALTSRGIATAAWSSSRPQAA